MKLVDIKDIIALTIWWCEGTKARRDYRWKNAFLYPIELTNTNPALINFFLDFLRKKLKIEGTKLRGQLQIHEGDNKDELEQYWSIQTHIPLDQFNKTIIRPKGNKPNKTRGTFKLRFYDKKIYLELKRLLDTAVIGA